MLDQFSATIRKIYAAGSGSSTWPEALFAIEELTGSTAAVINLVPNGQNLSPMNFVGSIAAEDVAEWAENYMASCPRIAAGVAMPDADYICDYMIISEAEMDRNPVYDWYSRHDLRYFVGSNLANTPRYKLMWSLQRSGRQGHAQEREIELVECLNPHLTSALLLADQIGTLRSFNRFSSAVLEALPHALFALDGQGTILFVNCAAELLIRIGDGLTCASTRLQARASAERGQLDRLIRASALVDVSGAGGWVRISRSNGGPPYAAFVAPLNCADEELLAARAKVVVIVHDTADHRAANPQMLMQIYALTDAEARLASALSAGHSIESAAALLEVQPATIRSQLKAIFRKVGVNRQQDLVRKLASLSASGSVHLT